MAGYEDVNDAERLSQDPTFRLIGSEKIWDRGAALTSRLQSFEIELLAEPENLAGLCAINRDLIAKAEAIDSPQRVVLDIDSTEIPVYGQQENSAYNGHFESTCYHTLLLFNREGDCLAAKLRPGNVHSADDWEEVLLPEIQRQHNHGKEVVVRADAAFAKPDIYEALEERGVNYAIRIPANENLERDIAELLPRPVGRPSVKPLVEYKSFLLQRLVDLRLGKGRVGSHHHFFPVLVLALDLGQLYLFPVVGAVHVAGPEFRRQAVAFAIE